MYQIVSRHHSVASLHHLGERMDGMWLIIIMAPKLAFIFIIFKKSLKIKKDISYRNKFTRMNLRYE